MEWKWMGRDGVSLEDHMNVIVNSEKKGWSFKFLKKEDGKWSFQGLVYKLEGEANSLEEAMKTIEDDLNKTERAR
jgi:hypothetical protein